MSYPGRSPDSLTASSEGIIAGPINGPIGNSPVHGTKYAAITTFGGSAVELLQKIPVKHKRSIIAIGKVELIFRIQLA
jgi:hypothetical protein